VPVCGTRAFLGRPPSLRLSQQPLKTIQRLFTSSIEVGSFSCPSGRHHFPSLIPCFFPPLRIFLDVPLGSCSASPLMTEARPLMATDRPPSCLTVGRRWVWVIFSADTFVSWPAHPLRLLPPNDSRFQLRLHPSKNPRAEVPHHRISFL